MGNLVAPDVLIQRALVTAQQIHFISQSAPGDGFHLPALIGKKSFYLGKGAQDFGFLQDSLTAFAEIFHRIRRIFIGACQQKGIHLSLGGRNGDNLDYVLLIRILLDGRTADDAVMTAHGAAHKEAVQQRRNGLGF